MTEASNARAGWIAGLLYATLWGGSVAYLYMRGADWTFPIFAIGVFGIGLSGLAWLLTRDVQPPTPEVKRPGVELFAILIYLALYALVFLGWGLGAARAALADGRIEEVGVLGLKLMVHVVLPLALLLALGVRAGPLFGPGLQGWRFWRALVVLGGVLMGLLAVVSPSLRNLEALEPALATLAWVGPASFLWIALEAGLCEEFLYRVVLQTRLAAFARSLAVGVFLSALIFGLAHAPGLFLRGGPGVDGWSTDPVQVAAFTVATLSPLGLFFGFVYARTRSLLLVVLLHGCVDVLPNMPDFIRTWA